MASEMPPSDAGAARVLEGLQSDRARLAERLRPPGWFAPGLGLVAAVVIAVPAVPEGAWRGSTLVAALAAGVALSSACRRRTGIELSRVGAPAWGIYALALGAPLLLLSVSFGLAAGGLHWWIAGCAAVGLGVVTWLVNRFVAAARRHLSHGR